MMTTTKFLTAAEVHKVIELTGEVASAMPGHFDRSKRSSAIHRRSPGRLAVDFRVIRANRG